jgi:hypothetical protein
MRQIGPSELLLHTHEVTGSSSVALTIDKTQDLLEL